MANKLEFDNEWFGEIRDFIEDDLVTDVNYDGNTVWIDHLKDGKYNSGRHLSDEFVNQFTMRLSNLVSKNFNKVDNVLEAETDELRLSIIHDSVSQGGVVMSIRKTPAVCRLTRESILETGYCPEEVIDFLSECVKAQMNIVFCGLPGSGKTELLKYLTKYIKKEDKAMTVEDNLEIHFKAINPDSHCVEIKVSEETMSFTKAIKTSLRQNVGWLLISEARSKEVKFLLESFSTGLHGMTTLHTDDVRKIPDRIQNMMGEKNPGVEADIYQFINVGVMIKKGIAPDGSIKRYVDQVCVFDRVRGENSCNLMLDRGELTDFEFPENIAKSLRKYIKKAYGEEALPESLRAENRVALK